MTTPQPTGEAAPGVQLTFDRDIAEQLDSRYRTRDIVRRRELVHNALGAKPGDRILDVGCGPGFVVAVFLEQVCPAGSVVGVDRNPQMVAVTARRCAGYRNVTEPEPDFTRETGRRTFGISEIMVPQEWTGKGVAHALHAHLLSARPESRASLLVEPENTKAYRIYLH